MQHTEATFWERVDQSGGPDACWPWTRGVNAGGYGKIIYGGKPQYVHRLAYYFTHGLLDRALVVDHMCHNKRCCNPAHLQLTDTSGNMQNRPGPQSNSRSGVRGVHWNAALGKWRVQIRAGGRNHAGGCYADLDHAARAASQLRAQLMDNSLLDRD